MPSSGPGQASFVFLLGCSEEGNRGFIVWLIVDKFRPRGCSNHCLPAGCSPVGQQWFLQTLDLDSSRSLFHCHWYLNSEVMCSIQIISSHHPFEILNSKSCQYIWAPIENFLTISNFWYDISLWAKKPFLWPHPIFFFSDDCVLYKKLEIIDFYFSKKSDSRNVDHTKLDIKTDEWCGLMRILILIRITTKEIEIDLKKKWKTSFSL